MGVKLSVLLSILLILTVHKLLKLKFTGQIDQFENMQVLQLLLKTQAQNLNMTSLQQTEVKSRCIFKDYAKIIHPDTILEDFYIYRRQSYRDSLRLYIRKYYFDANPNDETFVGQNISEISEIKSFPQYTTLLIHQFSYTKDRHVTEHCLFEKLMTMPFPQRLYDKVSLAVLMNNRIQRLRLQNASTECLRDAQFQKKTYILSNQGECKEFFDKVNLEYDSNNSNQVYKYVKKTNEHDQKGTELAFRDVMGIYQNLYDYGRNCTQPPQDIIMQEYINNPVLVKGRKFDIRLHVVVQSTHPLNVYLYKRFYLMKCSYKFNHSEFRNQSHICSAGYQRKMHTIYKETNITTENDYLIPLKDITQDVSYEEFADQLIEEGLITDRTWVDSYMIPEMDKRFSNYFQSYFEDETQEALADPRFGAYIACEFNVDDELNFWLLECTPMPNMVANPGQYTMRDFQTGLHSKAIPMLIKYQRQRFIKLRRFIEGLVQQIKQQGYQKALEGRASLLQEVSKILEDDIIIDPEIDNYFHRVNLKQGLQSCEGFERISL